jgi:hypothetical protein
MHMNRLDKNSTRWEARIDSTIIPGRKYVVNVCKAYPKLHAQENFNRFERENGEEDLQAVCSSTSSCRSTLTDKS